VTYKTRKRLQAKVFELKTFICGIVEVILLAGGDVLL